MSDGLFVLLMSAVLFSVLIWGFRTLPEERWQVLAVVPAGRRPDRSWTGLNLTYYGFFTASACTLSVAVVVLLLGALALSWGTILLIVAAVLALCIPAAGIVARIVEQKKHTLTIGGASFVGIVMLPWIVRAMNATGGYRLDSIAVCAAACIAYVLGEGLGRLACISFGCCYGKPLSRLHPILRTLFARWHFVFTGPTKKISYASGLEGQPVVPVQAVTALIFTASGLLGVHLFLKAHYAAAFLLPLAASQIWRVLSEMLRADHRGAGALSAYQWMALCSVPYAVIVTLSAGPPAGSSSSLARGLSLFESPLPFLVLQVFWTAVFLWTGRSSVTWSTLAFHVRKDRI